MCPDQNVMYYGTSDEDGGSGVQCQQNLHRQQDRNKGSCSSIKCPPHASAPRTEGTIELLFKPKYLVTEALFLALFVMFVDASVVHSFSCRFTCVALVQGC